MTRYAHHHQPNRTPQNERARANQRRNSAGGYTFVLEEWGRLDRWLILGAEGGTYYASERTLTIDNAKTVQRCLALDGPRTVAAIVAISDDGRAAKNEPAIFALAMAAGATDPATRKAALAALPRVCRTGTHLFQFVASVRNFRGWGRGLREAVCRWYLERTPRDMAYQAVKYQQRGGISHRDVLRLAGGALADFAVAPEQAAVFRWIVAGFELGAREVTRSGGTSAVYGPIDRAVVPELIAAYEAVKATDDRAEVVRLIGAHRLTHEMVPNEHKGSAAIWEALLEHMPLGATLRNLGKMSAVGLLTEVSDASRRVAARISDPAAIRRARIHPLAYLVALATYRGGRGIRGGLEWTMVPQIVDALDHGFYAAFGTIEATGRKRLVALDVSSSMSCGRIGGLPGVTPRVGSAAMAMTTVRTESDYHVVGFTTGLTSIQLSGRMRLDEVVARISDLPFGGTDCAQPMLWATEHGIELDAIEVYTDNETWAGRIHPHQALERYRDALGRDCKLIVVGMTATRFTIANSEDAGMLDVVGFDTESPRVMADFIRG